MYKVRDLVLHTSTEHVRQNRALGRIYSDSSSGIEDQRVARLLLLLRELQQSLGALAALPVPERTEIVSSAVCLSGFVHPLDAGNVIATILNELELQDLTHGNP
jgi:hypothetical protein